MSPRPQPTWALVTGASKGIGAACARALAAAGRPVVVHYGRDADGAAATVDACTALGVEARAVGADLTAGIDPIAEVVDEVGGLAALVNNAGVAIDGLIASLETDDYRRSIDVNLLPATALTRLALRSMLRARAGRIVNITSVIGQHGNAGQAAYAVAKAGLIGLTKSTAREVAKRGITANAVAPGFIATDMTAGLDADALLSQIPAGRLGSVEDVAGVVAFLCSEAAAYVNGEVVAVDGGMFA